MSDDILDKLKAPMDAQEKAFWEAVAPDGKRVTIEQLYDRLDDVLTDNPQFVQLPDAKSYALYSGRLDGASMHEAAQALAKQSGGAVGIIDNTQVGKSLGLFAELSGASQNSPEIIDDIIARYGDYIDIEGSVAEFGDAAFTNQTYAAFDNPSTHFARHATGDVIALSPRAYPGSAYARVELPTLLKGVDEGRINSLNGLTADDLADAIEQARANGFAPVDHPLRSGIRIDDTNYPYGTGQSAVDGSIGAQFDKVSVDDFVEDAVERVRSGEPPLRASPPDSGRVDPGRPGAADPAATPGPSTSTTPEPGRGTSVFDEAAEAVADMKASAPASTAAQLAARGAGSLPVTQRIDSIIEASAQGKMRAFSADPNGRSVYVLDELSNTIHFIKDGALQNTPPLENLTDARLAFGSMLHSAGKNFPDAHNGIPKISGSLGELADHMSSIKAPGWVRSVSNSADEAGSFLGRASKILGPLGVAAAGYEAHAAQATLDPSLVLGEGAVQGAFELWKNQYDVNDEVGQALRPGSLVRDLNSLKNWMGERAAEAGEVVEDYVLSRADNPQLIFEDFRAAGRLGARVLGDAYDKGAELAEDLSNYANSRWDNPELILDDLTEVGEAAKDGASWIWDRANNLWDSVFGDDPNPGSVVLGDSPKVEIELTLGDAARQFMLDRNAIREILMRSESFLMQPKTRVLNGSPLRCQKI